jgi:hypothetical protein
MCLAQSAAIFAAVDESGAPRLPPAACEMTPVSSILSGCLSAAMRRCRALTACRVRVGRRNAQAAADKPRPQSTLIDVTIGISIRTRACDAQHDSLAHARRRLWPLPHTDASERPGLFAAAGARRRGAVAGSARRPGRRRRSRVGRPAVGARSLYGARRVCGRGCPSPAPPGRREP